MQKYDVIIVGGGMVGLSLALGLRQTCELSVAVIDQQTLTPLSNEPENRVSAINIASQRFLQNVGAWKLIEQQRLQPYHSMHVWDKQGLASLLFDQKLVNKNQLGWIIENNVIRTALWQTAEQHEGITFINQPLQSVAVGDNEAFVTFEQGMPITGKLVVGADGANSWLRQQLDMPMIFKDYDHHAVVATVDCELGHNNTAWQVFLPEGPLAFLPLYKHKACSIVWSTSPEQANELLSLEPEAFNNRITAASDGKLGNITLQSQPQSFPLTMRLTQQFVKSRIVFIGDAAHTIHPLAGQGVNLGFLDASALIDTIEQQVINEHDLAHEVALNQFSRWRKTEAAEMIVAMEIIKQTFMASSKPAQFIRGLGLSFLDKLSPVKKIMIEQALGERKSLPKLSQLSDSLS